MAITGKDQAKNMAQRDAVQRSAQKRAARAGLIAGIRQAANERRRVKPAVSKAAPVKAAPAKRA